LYHGPLPIKEYLLKFQLVDYLDDDDVVDFVVVHGDDIDSLVVHSYAKPAKTASGLEAQIKTLLDAMAAFCRLKSAADLRKVSAFKSEKNFRLQKF
jgi:UDP-2,3-diacylglucosamine pyrophosphatase LpxH